MVKTRLQTTQLKTQQIDSFPPPQQYLSFIHRPKPIRARRSSPLLVDQLSEPDLELQQLFRRITTAAQRAALHTAAHLRIARRRHHDLQEAAVGG
jgi:hypothetical protein